jgi:hypothetical protein
MLVIKRKALSRGKVVQRVNRAAIRAGLAPLLFLTLFGSANARHHGHWSGGFGLFGLPLFSGTVDRHRWHGDEYREFGGASIDDPGRDSRPGRHPFEQIDPDSSDNPIHGWRAGRRPSEIGGPLSVLKAQFIRDCERQIAELKNFPIDAIAQSIGPDDAQDNALKNAGRAADEVAEKLAQTCPKGVPAEPSARLDAVEHGIDAVRAALSTLEPPVQAFYESLKDDQKARLIARYVAAGSSGGRVAETTGSGSRAAATGARRRMRFFIDDVPSPTAQMWNCEQWQAELRAWPIARVEQVIAVAARQRAAFYDLAASIQRAADMLADSCPREATPTPIGRIEELRKKLDAVRESFTAIEPALDRFYDVLDAGQRARFSDAI